MIITNNSEVLQLTQLEVNCSIEAVLMFWVGFVTPNFPFIAIVGVCKHFLLDTASLLDLSECFTFQLSCYSLVVPGEAFILHLCHLQFHL